MATQLIDRRAFARNQRRWSGAGSPSGGFLHARVADDIAARIAAVNRQFDTALEVGDRFGHMAGALRHQANIDRVVSAGLFSGEKARAIRPPHGHRPGLVPDQAGHRPGLVLDDELWPVGKACMSLIVSSLCLQFANDLPGALVQIRQSLRADGAFFAALVGGDSLFELRHSLVEAELTLKGGAHGRVIPFADMAALGDLLPRAGFALSVADRETLCVHYPSLRALMDDLRALGWSNCLAGRPQNFSSAAFFKAAQAHYASAFGMADGRLPAHFDIVYLHGWAPHDSQQKPLRPGSARHSLARHLAHRTGSAGKGGGM